MEDITASFTTQKHGSLTIIIGPIGSGKSSLLKAIVGETQCTGEMVSVSTSEVAFCDQTPWIMNGSIRANIIGESKGFDKAWPKTVVKACDLQIDLSALPKGDLTEVGDKGVRLSGGQKRRIVSCSGALSRSSRVH